MLSGVLIAHQLTFMSDPLTLVPLSRPPTATVRVPGSKSITNRALVLAALAARQGSCVLHNVLRSEDTEVMMTCLRALGFDVRGDGSEVTVGLPQGCSDIIPAKTADLFVANSGTTMRFLTAMVSLGHGRYRLDGTPRMRERPIGDLLDSLRQLGVRACCEQDTGCPPVIVEADGLKGGRVTIKGDVSSQFLSGLLMAAPLAAGDVAIQVEGPLVSEPYIGMTVAMMRQFGAQMVTASEPLAVTVPGGQVYAAHSYDIEPDASAASYFFAAAAITGGTVTVPRVGQDSLQGDIHFVELLEQMGCQAIWNAEGVTVRGGPLRGIDADMSAISDTVMTLAAVACFADRPTAICNVAHVRYKETDRLAALATELGRVGAGVEELPDGLIIRPAPLHGATLETYNDHRMAMSLALLGLRVPGIRILNPGCVAKTYPDYFADLENLRI